MKQTIILGLAMGLSLTSITTFAATDSKYPASDFQPKVVFIDKESVKSSAATPAADNKCKPEKVATATAAEFDPKYPAANFQPKVIYP